MTPTEKLAAYLEEERITQTEFAKEIDVAPAMVSLWLAGKRRPDLTNAFAIEEATDQRIMAREWSR